MNEKRLVFQVISYGIALIVSIFVAIKLTQHPKYVVFAIVAFYVMALVLFRGFDRKDLTPYQFGYYLLYSVALLVAFSPSKLLGYLGPFIFIGALICYFALIREPEMLRRVLIFLVLELFMIVSYIGLNREFVLQNAIISFFTYSSFYPLFLMPSRRLSGNSLLYRMFHITALMMLVQALIGISQGIYGILSRGGFAHSAGDFVEGTIDIMPSPSLSLSNVMFCINLSLGLYALIYLRLKYQKKNTLAILICLGASLLAAVLHISLIWLTTLILAFIIILPSSTGRKPFIWFFLFISFVGMTFVLSAGIGHYLTGWYHNARYGNNFKVQAYENYFKRVPKENVVAFTLGAGPGQYAGRAPAIAAGYLGGLPPGFKFLSTPYFKHNMLQLWINWGRYRGRSAANSPGSSWLAATTEWGIFSAFIILGIVIKLVYSTYKQSRRNSEVRLEAFLFVGGVLCIFFIGFPGLYWEVPQAVFMPCLFLKCLHANIFYGQHTESEADS